MSKIVLEIPWELDLGKKIGVIRNHRLSGLEVCVIELVTSLSVTASWFLITLLDFDR